MGHRQTAPGHFEVTYSTVEDMAPELQPDLLASIERELATSAVTVLFIVESRAVPRTVPEFWLKVTTRHAPRLCALAIVSESIAVRAATSAFAVANSLRSVPLHVKAFTVADLEKARQWCHAHRVMRGERATARAQ